MANGYPIIPSPLRVRGLAGDQQRGLSQLPPTYLASRAGVPSYKQLPQRVGESVMPSAVLTPQQRAAQATQRLAQLTQSRGGGSDVMPVTQQRPRGFFDSLPSPMSPAGQGLTAAATTGLQLSGWQDRPITLGSALGAMGQAGMEAYTAAQEREAAGLAAERRSKLDEALLALKIAEASKPDYTAAQKNAMSMGFEIGSPEYNDFIMKSVTRPETQIFMGGDKQKELAYGAALKTREDMVKQVGLDRELGSRLQQVIDLINSGVETGRVQSALLPIKQIGRELGFLSDEDIAELTNQEIIDSAAAFLTPRMRVVGSGASSDRDMDFFARATVRMANTPEANLVIATMQKQLMDYNRKRLGIFDKYVEGKGHDFGFGDYADEQMGEVYKRVQTSEELTQLVDDGKIKEGDVFYNAATQEFDILTKEMM